MKHVLLAAVCSLACAQMAHAFGQENEGGTPGRAILDCADESSQVRLVIQETPAGDATAYVSMFADPTNLQRAFAVAQAPVAPGVMGASDVYAGNGFSLSIFVDGPAQPEGHASTLTVPSMGIKKHQVFCHFETL